VSSDIGDRLRNHSKRSVGCDCVRCEAAAEIINLRQWKLEATQVLARWDAVADLVPAQLGQRLSDAVANEITRLRAEVERIEDHCKLRADLAYLMKCEKDDALAEIERLRTAGKALAEVAVAASPWITPVAAMVQRERIRAAVASWNEACRG